jgi:hypothetical protein
MNCLYAIQDKNGNLSFSPSQEIAKKRMELDTLEYPTLAPYRIAVWVEEQPWMTIPFSVRRALEREVERLTDEAPRKQMLEYIQMSNVAEDITSWLHSLPKER